MENEKKNAGEKRTTSLSKFLRILRIKNDEVLGDMAEKLGIMPSYLSSIEANKRPLTPALKEKLIDSYSLDREEQEYLENCIAEASRSVEVNLDNVKDESILSEYVDTAVMFARDISKLGNTELDEIRNLLKSFTGKEGEQNEKRNFHKSQSVASKRI